MTKTHGPRALAVLATTAVLALSACGGGSGSETSSTSSTTKARTEGGKATSAKSGVSFTVPKGWQVINPSEIKAGSQVPDAVKDMAKAQGTTPEKLAEDIKGLDLLIIGQSNGKFVDNASVIAAPTMPTTAEMLTELDGVGAKVDDAERVKTPLGSGLDATYTLSRGGIAVNGRVVAIPTDSGSALITVSTSDADEADKVVQTILDSIDKT